MTGTVTYGSCTALVRTQETGEGGGGCTTLQAKVNMGKWQLGERSI